jgi:hypothetical protein
MEDNRGTKHLRSPSAEGSPSTSNGKTPPLHHLCLHRHPDPRWRSLCIALARRCPSRGGSGKAPVINLSSSSDEEDLIAATSHDFEFTQRLFDELNRAVMGPPGDDKIIVLSDSDEEEVREEKTTDTEDVTASAAVNPASTADADDASAGAKNDNSDDQRPDQEAGSGNDSRGDAGEP